MICKKNFLLVTVLLALPLLAQANITLSVDSPKPGLTYTGIGDVRGWVVSDVPIDRVELWVNGENRGEIPCCSPRRDVEKKYGQLDVGFSRTVPYSAWGGGEVEVVVRAVDIYGNSKSLAVEFKVSGLRSYMRRSDVSLSGAQLESGDDDTLIIYGAQFQGVKRNIQLEWRPERQQFEIVGISPAITDDSSGGNDYSGGNGGNDSSGDNGGSGNKTPEYQHVTGTETYQSTVLAAINKYRAKGVTCGDDYYGPTQPLIWSDKLANAALKHSIDMAENNFTSHTGSDGSSVGDRVKREGFNWSWVGENIAWGFESPEEPVEWWIKSPGHCANIMNPNFRYVGHGMVYAKNTDWWAYWTMDFAK